MLTLDAVEITQGAFRLRADFTIEAGRVVAVIGPSGAGKSTLIGAICGFVPITHGALRWQGHDITHTHPGKRPMAMLFQDNNLFPHLTLTQNVGLGLRPDLRLSGADKSRVADTLARVDLQSHTEARPATLSGGQQSRAALARVMVQDRPVIVLDEPFAALGPALRSGMLDLVQDLAREQNATLLMVTHAPEDVRRIADDVIFVEGGIAQPPRPAAALMDSPPPALQAYLGDL